MAQCSRSLLPVWPSASPLPPASGVCPCLSFPSCSQEKPLSAWLNLASSTTCTQVQEPLPGCRGERGWRSSTEWDFLGMLDGMWGIRTLEAGGTEEGCAGPCPAVLCHPDRTPCSRGWGCGDVFCRSLAAAWMELPGNCRVEAKREQSGSCRDPRSSIPPRTPRAVGPSKGHGLTCCVPPAAATIPPRGCRRAVVCRGMDPGEGDWEDAGSVPQLFSPTGVSRGCKVGLGAVGMGRMGAQHPAGAGQENQPQASATSRPALSQNLPRNLPRHLPRHAGARCGLAGGRGGVWQPPRPARPARGGIQPQGCQGGGSRTQPRPFPTLWQVQRAGLGVRGWVTPQLGMCPPCRGRWGGAALGGGAVPCAPGLAWGSCVGVRGGPGTGVCRACGAARGRGLWGCAPRSRCVTEGGDRLRAGCPPRLYGVVGRSRVAVPRGCEGGMRGDGCGGV